MNPVRNYDHKIKMTITNLGVNKKRKDKQHYD